MAKEDDLFITFKEDYCCPFCGAEPITHSDVLVIGGIGEFDEVLCDACGETIAYQKPSDTGD